MLCLWSRQVKAQLSHKDLVVTCTVIENGRTILQQKKMTAFDPLGELHLALPRQDTLNFPPRTVSNNI